MQPQRFIHALILIVSVGLLQITQAVVPPPDGGYPNFTTAEGTNALKNLTTGAANTGVGWYSLFTNSTASYNTGGGAATLVLNNGDENTATGTGGLFLNSTGNQNTANGAFTLFNNSTGGFNTAVGYEALNRNEEGNRNNAFGWHALGGNVSGSSNNAFGVGALPQTNGSNNTAIGDLAGNLILGSGNVCIGAGVLGTNGESNSTRIRNIGSTGIVGGASVVIETLGGIGDGRLGVITSSRRYKEDITPMDEASATLFALKPVTFRAKGHHGPIKHYGLIAEDVAAVEPDLVMYNAKGQPETLRFDSINAMLLNEFLKEHQRVQELMATVAQQQSRLDQQQKQIASVTADLQRVSASIRAGKPAPQLVANP
jgi:hypothetical protein